MRKRSRQDGSQVDRSTGLSSVFGSLPDESDRPPPEPAVAPGDEPPAPREPTLAEIEQHLAEVAERNAADEAPADHDHDETAQVAAHESDETAEAELVAVGATARAGDATTELPEWGAGQGWAPDDLPPLEEEAPEWGAGPDLPDGPPPDPPYTRRRRRIWPWFVFLGILIAPAIIISSCVAVTGALNPKPVQAADLFIAALDEGRIQDAYAMLCPSLRDTIPYSDFAADVAGADQIVGYRSFSVPAPLLADTDVVTSNIEMESGASIVGTFEVSTASGDWMICRFPPLPATP